MPGRKSGELAGTWSIRARLGAGSAGLALGAALVSGCASSARETAAAADVSIPATAKAPPSQSSSEQPAAESNVCQVMSLNLDLLTKVTSSPNDPALDRSVNHLQRLVATAPEEIRSDLRVIADFDQKVLTSLRGGGSADAIQESPELTAALAHEARWTSTHCSSG